MEGAPKSTFGSGITSAFANVAYGADKKNADPEAMTALSILPKIPWIPCILAISYSQIAHEIANYGHFCPQTGATELNGASQEAAHVLGG